MYYCSLNILKGGWSSVWISIEQSVIVSGIGYAFMGFMVRDWSWATEFNNYGSPTGTLTTIGSLIIFLFLLKVGWHVFTCVKMTSVKSFCNRLDHLFKSYDQKCKWSIYVYRSTRHIILAAFDTKSHCAIRYTWVLSPKMYMLARCIYNRYPVRDQCVRAC